MFTDKERGKPRERLRNEQHPGHDSNGRTSTEMLELHKRPNSHGSMFRLRVLPVRSMREGAQIHGVLSRPRRPRVRSNPEPIRG
jgi:hypothetical protein